MEAKVGDRVSLDAKKVGQVRRSGEVRDIVQGLAGTRYAIRWDDGTESVLSPSFGSLIVEKGRKPGRRAKSGARGAAKKTAAKTTRTKAPKPAKKAAKTVSKARKR